jgi:hypothetical protein
MAEPHPPDFIDRLLARVGIGERPPHAGPRLPGLFERPLTTAEPLDDGVALAAPDSLAAAPRWPAATALGLDIPVDVGSERPPADRPPEPTGSTPVAAPRPDPERPTSAPAGRSALHEVLREVRERLVPAASPAVAADGSAPPTVPPPVAVPLPTSRPAAATADPGTIRPVVRAVAVPPVPERRARPVPPQQPAVHVNIGRIEVTAAAPRDTDDRRRPRSRPALDLAGFLAERENGRS